VLLKKVNLPKKMTDKLLYPALTLASREQHRVQINLGLRSFKFSLDCFL
jgi:hypothetical protein